MSHRGVLPGEVCVVLVDQIFLDPEIIVAGWKEHDLLIRGVVTIPEGKNIHPKTEDFKYYCLKISIARLKNFPSYDPTMVSLGKRFQTKTFSTNLNIFLAFHFLMRSPLLAWSPTNISFLNSECRLETSLGKIFLKYIPIYNLIIFAAKLAIRPRKMNSARSFCRISFEIISLSLSYII